MLECNKVNAKVTDTELKKLKTAVKKKTGTTLRMRVSESESLKMLDGSDLPQESLLTTIQKTKPPLPPSQMRG